jgi:hypothetical protein
MKKTLLFILAIFTVFIICFAACSDADDDSEPESTPVHTASGLWFRNTDYDTGEIGGIIFIEKAQDESDITHYVLFWGSGSKIAEIKKTGADLLVHTIPDDTPIPASHILVFTRNNTGLMSTCISYEILDVPVLHTIDGNFDLACSVYAVDVDGDGDIDVLGAAADADDITWWKLYSGNNTNGRYNSSSKAGSFMKAF